MLVVELTKGMVEKGGKYMTREIRKENNAERRNQMKT
jgi:hypothetical protein